MFIRILRFVAEGNVRKLFRLLAFVKHHRRACRVDVRNLFGKKIKSNRVQKKLNEPAIAATSFLYSLNSTINEFNCFIQFSYFKGY